MSTPRATLRQLRVFTAIADTGSTTAAGEALGLSQSAASAALKVLESLLAAPLFDRAGKRLILNDLGRSLLPGARSLLDAASALIRTDAEPDRQVRALRIGASSTIGNYRLPALLARLHGRAPDRGGSWQARVAIGNTAAIVADVAAFNLDIGLIEGQNHDPAVIATPWRSDDLMIVSPPDGRREMDLAGLQDQVWLLREPGSGTREATDQLLAPWLGPWQRSIEFGSSEAIKHAVAAGLGVACLSRWVVEDMLASGALIRLETPLPPLARICYWIVNRDKQMTPALATFIDVIADDVIAADATDAGVADAGAALTPTPALRSPRF